MAVKSVIDFFAARAAALRLKLQRKKAVAVAAEQGGRQDPPPAAAAAAGKISSADQPQEKVQADQGEAASREAARPDETGQPKKAPARRAVSEGLAAARQHFQHFGSMLIIPLACLACAGFLMVLADLMSRLAVPFSDPLLQAGLAVYRHAPLLFAAGIVNSLITHEKGLAILAASLSALIWSATAVAVTRHAQTAGALSFYNLGWLTGIACGFVTYGLFRFTERKIRSPRLARLINPHTLVVWQMPLSVIGGSAMALLWLLAERLLSRTAAWIYAGGESGLFAYGLLNRLLLPFGLHHILDDNLWLQAGDFTTQSGQLVQGDLQRFLAGDPTAGQFTAGLFPVMLFLVPAMLLAIWLSGRSSNRQLPVMLIIAAGLLSLAGGITEPADYLVFLFSPLLYVFYAILAGLSMVAAAELQVLHGFSFSAGLIDYVSFWSRATRPAWLLLVGAALGVIAFVVFWLVLRHLRGSGPDMRFEQTGFWRRKNERMLPREDE